MDSIASTLIYIVRRDYNSPLSHLVLPNVSESACDDPWLSDSNSFRRNQIKWISVTIAARNDRQESVGRRQKWKKAEKTEENIKWIEVKCMRRRSSSGWRRQPAASTTQSESDDWRIEVLHVYVFSVPFRNSTRDFPDSLTICNYNLPSTINTWFRLKFCRRWAALIVCLHETINALAFTSCILRPSGEDTAVPSVLHYEWSIIMYHVPPAFIANRQLCAAISFGGSTR